MSNLIFSLNASLPVFCTMMLGWLFRRIGVMDERFASAANSFVFKIALPVNLFNQLYAVDILAVWDTTFVVYCFAATFLSIAIAWLLSHFVTPRDKGEFVQASYRSSSSLLGMAYIQNVYGTAEMGSLMIIGAVPLYNVAAVLILSLMKPDGGALNGAKLKKTLKGVATNTIIWGILIGMLWAMLKLPMPTFCAKTISNVAATSTPLGLMAMGAQLDFKKMGGALRSALGASFLKLVGFAAIFVPVAVMLGYREQKLMAALIMLGSATTVTSYVTARNMGHDGVLSSAVTMLTTLLSAVTLTFWIYLLKSLGML